MKQLLLISAIALAATTLPAQERVPVANVTGKTVMRPKDGQMNVGMNLDLSDIKVKSNRAVLISPYIINGQDSLALPEVVIYGRQQYLYYIRNGRPLTNMEESTVFRKKEMPESLAYSAQADMRPWMDGARLKVWYCLFGCCGDLIDDEPRTLGQWERFVPQIVFSRPPVDTVKVRELADTAYVDFIVDKTYIAPEYHNNVQELGRIRASIDSVRSDKDVTIRKFFIKGYASPESPYSHNTDLAKGRTEAIRQYVQNLYHFDPAVMFTEYEPENWEGLRRDVERGNLTHREEILALIDSDEEPDRKEWLIKSRYPEDYRFLLQTVYPFLRRTDYRIEYTVRSYTDLAEILRVMKTRPQNLSLNELFIAAQSFPDDSDEAYEAYELAARMYPHSTDANLNAANAAMARGDYRRAEQYLREAGDSQTAEYARGVCCFLQEDYTKALEHFRNAGDMPEAEKAIEEINKTIL